MANIKLGDVCDFQNGYAFKRQDFLKSGIKKILKITNINQDFTINENNLSFFNIEIKNENKYKLQINDIVIAMSGATTGKIAKVHLDGFWLNQRVGKFIPKLTLKNCYLFYLLQKHKVIIEKMGFGSAQPNISWEQIKTLELTLPTLQVQQQIIDIIEPFEKILYNYKLKLNKINNILISLYKTLSIDNLISINKIIKVNFNKYDEQKYYYDTSTISTSKIGIPELISFNKKSRANLTPEKNSIIISKLIGENKIFPIFTSFYDNSVFSTGFLNFSSKYSAYVYGYMLTNEFINIKKSTMSGSVMASINNKSINNWQINDINIKKWDNKFDNLLILINYYNSLILKINNVIKKLIDLYII